MRMVIRNSILFTLLFFATGFAQLPNLKFENYDTSEGISSSTCLEIFEDSDGFLWFGTIDGLNRFNGYDFEIYRPSLTGSNAISNNRVNAITQDGQGRLWIGTSNGLNVLDKKQDKFYKIEFTGNREDKRYREIINTLYYDKAAGALFIGSRNGLIHLSLTGNAADIAAHPVYERYVNNPSDKQSLDNNNVTNITKTGNGNFWFVTDGNAVNCYSTSKKKITRYAIDLEGKGFLGHLPKQLMTDNNGNLWIGNDLSRLYVFNPESGSVKKREFTSASVPVFHLLMDSKGIIWASTDGNGLYLISPEKGVSQHIIHNNDDAFSLPNNQPSKVLEDKNGIYWIASYNKGINKLALSRSRFGHYYYKSGKEQGISTKIAQAVAQTRDGKIWVGTDGGGLNLFNEKSNTFTFFSAGHTGLSSDKILYLKEGNDNDLWVGTWDGGLNRFNTVTHTVKTYKHNAKDPFSIGQNTVWCIEKDRQNRLWVGTSAAGLNLFDPVTERFYKYKYNASDPKSLINNFVFSLYNDSKNRLLVGTAQGICYADISKMGTPNRLLFTELKIKNITDNRVNYITEDHAHHIWIGTDVGLYELSENFEPVHSYSTNNGLPNNYIVGIQEDNRNRMWITTKSGLSVLDTKSGAIRSFNVHDGLQGLEFQSKSICKTADGRIIAGGINGFNIFDPESIKPNKTRLKPYITDLRLFNKKVNPGDTLNNRVILKQSVSLSGELALRYNEDYLGLGFVALNYQNPERVKYAYRLLGLHDNYIELGNERMASYSNLSPGNYTFEVIASEDGNWKEGGKAILPLTILPPPWKTWWAYALYTIILISGFWLAMRYYTRKVREEKEHELDQMKLRFFINVSHEFRTPLTLILNPVDKILSSYNDPEQVKNAAVIIQRSSRRLLYLVNQLLDFRKVDLGESSLELQRVNVVKFTKDILALFEDLAKTKNIAINLESSVKNRVGMLDPDKLEKILTNLLSNAIKFTGQHGTINITVTETTQESTVSFPISLFKGKQEGEYLKISVSDTGIGFKQEHLKDVFRRFFHADASMSGTGIGLNYTKALVELHKGQITVNSIEGKGTTFTVLLPLNLKPVSMGTGIAGEISNYVLDANPIKSAEYEIAISNENEQDDEKEQLFVSDANRPLLLIVEDNKELRTHLKNELSVQFRVKEAANGATGLEMVKKYYPDIVISDVMMPQMDGFEMCRQIKNELEISHIPVILLTARSLEEDKIEGYDTGADEYLPKPFNINVLKARVRNLLEARKRTRDRFVMLGGVTSETKNTANTVDEVFLDKATKVVLDNISNADFSLEDIIREIGLGRSQFYRKINAITGQNPSNFIRTIKLKHAAELLLSKKYSVKEVTHLCGFNSSAYFTKTFKELFGITPTQYIDAGGAGRQQEN